MCTGLEIMAFVGTAMSVLQALKPKPKQPEVVQTDPVADDLKAKTAAAQEAQAATLEQRKKMRANSLLSQAGAAGDMSTAETSNTQAKAVLGA